ncbi:hypothetical protein HK098_000016 [Nowakowskiella sp. JEL0407]|nr:hypothetical protein HK098_000016 [Nowakowskiella sp. JEL0407]
MSAPTNFEYCDSVNQNLICSICYLPFFIPVLTPCGHTFCKECIELHISNNPELGCPIDRARLSFDSLSPVARIIENLVDELQVFCTNKSLGCEWTGQRQLLNSHLNQQCDFQTALCPKCLLNIPVHMQIAHVQQCQTSSSLNRSDENMGCNWGHLGCVWKGPEADLTDHLRTCTFESIKSYIQMQDRRYQTVLQQNEQLKDQVERLQTQVRTYFCNIPEHESIAHPNSFDHTLARLGEDSDVLRADFENLNASVAALEVKQDMNLMQESSRLRDEIHSIKALCHAMQLQLIYLLEKRKESTPTLTTGSMFASLNGYSSELSRDKSSNLGYDRNTKL